MNSFNKLIINHENRKEIIIFNLWKCLSLHDKNLRIYYKNIKSKLSC